MSHRRRYLTEAEKLMDPQRGEEPTDKEIEQAKVLAMIHIARQLEIISLRLERPWR